MEGPDLMESNFRHTAEDLRREIEGILQKVGILCRVFARGKEERSIKAKLSKSPDKYKVGGKLIQDVIGVRVALYFAEDVEIVAALLLSQFENDPTSSTIDFPATDQFTVTRHNLIFKVPERYRIQVIRGIGSLPIDLTFEVQLRSILSEGWHEVDHDLRYKSIENWDGQDDLSRALNGIMATLETADWSMRRIFDDLAYRHYRQKRWAAMLHNKVRMRTQPKLSDDLIGFFNKNEDFAKEMFRINRKKVIKRFHILKPSLPVTLDNVVYVWNHIGPRNTQVIEFTPSFIKDVLEAAEPASVK